MASYIVNERAVKRARRLIRGRQYVLNSNWGDVQPNAEAENAFLASHSWDEYGEWHPGLTEGASDETKARYACVYGDFRASTEPASSPATTAPPGGGIRRSSWQLTICCSASIDPVPDRQHRD